MRKAQVTIYIIIGVILIILIALASYVMTRTEEVPITGREDASADFEPIREMVQFCLKKSSIDAVNVISEAGGYYDSPKESLQSMSGSIAYHYYKGQLLVPTKNRIEEEISKYVEDAVKYCVNYRPFEETGFIITAEEPQVMSNIEENTLFVNMNYMVTVEKGGKEQSFNLFRHNMPYMWNKINRSMDSIVKSIADDPLHNDLTLLLDQEFPVQMVEFQDCMDVYIILDNETFSENTLFFRFAVHYDEGICLRPERCDDLSLSLGLCTIEEEPYIPHTIIPKNNPPILDSIAPQKGSVGELLKIKVNATDPDGDMIFYLATGIIENEIDVSTGMISYIPAEPGYHFINVTAVDIYGAIDWKAFQLEVT